MKISVITPTFNSEKTIARNAQSIVSQTHKDFEHIIIDNLSSDNTVGILKRLYEENKITGKLKIISERDSGISDAFNKGINAASGNAIAILNSDDAYYSSQVF
jgi:glycosyltransferase involved in cell wall biosynthesis